jgi:hypothetical protein
MTKRKPVDVCMVSCLPWVPADAPGRLAEKLDILILSDIIWLLARTINPSVKSICGFSI